MYRCRSKLVLQLRLRLTKNRSPLRRARERRPSDAATKMAEPFTRLAPAPEVTIDKEKYTKVVKLLGLRVPKVRDRVHRREVRNVHRRRRPRDAPHRTTRLTPSVSRRRSVIS